MAAIGAWNGAMTKLSLHVAAPLAAAALLWGPTALAAEAPDGPTVTAPTVSDQIEAYLRDSPAARLPEAAPGSIQGLEAAPEAGPRKIHGEVSVAAGSHGYRSVYARTDMPIGKTGTLSLAVGDSRGGWVGPRFVRGCGGPAGPDIAGDLRCDIRPDLP